MGNQAESPASNAGSDFGGSGRDTINRASNSVDMRAPDDSNLAQQLRNNNGQPNCLNNLQIDMGDSGTAYGAQTGNLTAIVPIGQPHGESQSRTMEKNRRSVAMHEFIDGVLTFPRPGFAQNFKSEAREQQQDNDRSLPSSRREEPKPKAFLRDLDLLKRDDYKFTMHQQEGTQQQENVDPVRRPTGPERTVPEAKLDPIKPSLKLPKIPSIDDLLKLPSLEEARKKNQGRGDGTPPGEAKPLERRPEAGKAPVTDTQLEELANKYKINPKMLSMEKDRAEKENMHKTFTKENIDKLLQLAQKHRLLEDFNDQGLHSMSRPGAFVGKLIPELLHDPDNALSKGQTTMKEHLTRSMKAGLAEQHSIDQAMHNVDRKIANVRISTHPFISDVKRELRKPAPRTDVTPDGDLKPRKR